MSKFIAFIKSLCPVRFTTLHKQREALDERERQLRAKEKGLELLVEMQNETDRAMFQRQGALAKESAALTEREHLIAEQTDNLNKREAILLSEMEKIELVRKEREEALRRAESSLLNADMALRSASSTMQVGYDLMGESRKEFAEFVKAHMDHLAEKEAFLAKVQKDLDAQKEFMLGQDNTEMKKAILLPAMKKKWEAEAQKIDAERVAILQSAPTVKASMESRRKELENRIAYLQKKPDNAANQRHMLEAEFRLKELDEVIAIVDQERRTNEKALSA